jgi:hypothetical protein
MFGLNNGAVDTVLLGMMVGDKLGAVLRIEDRATEGEVLDKVVDVALGTIIGLDGTTDGVLLGGILWLKEEITVGRVGANVGMAVGPVGFIVGFAVGFTVGGYL